TPRLSFETNLSVPRERARVRVVLRWFREPVTSILGEFRGPQDGVGKAHQSIGTDGPETAIEGPVVIAAKPEAVPGVVGSLLGARRNVRPLDERLLAHLKT